MKITIKNEIVNGMLISMEQDGMAPGYVVCLAKMETENTCGGYLDYRWYATRREAQRRFRDLKKREEAR